MEKCDSYPEFGIIRQAFEPGREANAEESVGSEFIRTGLLNQIKKGDKVLITAGSRGISCMIDVLRGCVKEVRKAGGVPLLFPAMGSHGRGEAELQVEVLAHLGITEDSIGAPVYSDMETVRVGTVLDDVPLYVDRVVAEADHILIVNRVKVHTEYIGETESGLLKMAVVGLGRHAGAEIMHKLAVNITYYKAIQEISKGLFKNLNILAGVAIIEDHTNRLAKLEVVPASEVFEREPELLEESKKYRSKLPVEDLDILLVDEIGKDISGAGMDTKVIGRIMNIYEEECTTPRITRIVVRDLTERTAGNATGIGLADYTTQRAYEKIDFKAVNTNCITAVAPEKARIPMVLSSDREALQAAFDTIGLWSPETVKVAWISNTLSMELMAVSGALAKEMKNRDDIEVYDGAFDLPFDEEGNLPGISDIITKRKHDRQ